MGHWTGDSTSSQVVAVAPNPPARLLTPRLGAWEANRCRVLIAPYVKHIPLCPRGATMRGAVKAQSDSGGLKEEAIKTAQLMKPRPKTCNPKTALLGV